MQVQIATYTFSVSITSKDSAFLTAAWGKKPPHTPVWFMRQAGRSLPEYKKLRKKGSILESLTNPELAAEITLQPVRRYGVDAAVLYSDIMVPLCAVSAGVEMVEGKGPVVSEPYGSLKDLKRLRQFNPAEDAPFVAETIKILIKELEVPLIGFAGAPFTLASYLIEGGSSRNYLRTKVLMHSEKDFFQQLMQKLADMATSSLIAQLEAGVGAVQLFDSWAGALSPPDYERFVLPHTRRIFSALKSYGVPRIHFGVGTGELLEDIASTGVEVAGVDWTIKLSTARKRAVGVKALQGNLDPALCLADWESVKSATQQVLTEAGESGGHIFNLGHGVLPETDPDILARIVDLVHSQTSQANK